ncbi:MAG: hypothetical protein HZA68_12905 [Rhodovulum sp.]|nr:hypothetical protein [Rhodovulum sp.]
MAEDGAGRIYTLLLDIRERLAIVETQSTAILAEQGRAAENRQAVFDRLAAITLDEAAVRQRVERIEPIVDRLNAAHQRSKGAAMLARALWTVAGGAVGAAAAFVAAKLGIKP